MKAAVFHDINDFQVRLRKLFGRKLQAVIHQIGIETHARKLFKQLHKMTFRKAALPRGFLNRDVMVIKFLNVIQRIF